MPHPCPTASVPPHRTRARHRAQWLHHCYESGAPCSPSHSCPHDLLPRRKFVRFFIFEYSCVSICERWGEVVHQGGDYIVHSHFYPSYRLLNIPVRIYSSRERSRYQSKNIQKGDCKKASELKRQPDRPVLRYLYAATNPLGWTDTSAGG